MAFYWQAHSAGNAVNINFMRSFVFPIASACLRGARQFKVDVTKTMRIKKLTAMIIHSFTQDAIKREKGIFCCLLQ